MDSRYKTGSLISGNFPDVRYDDVSLFSILQVVPKNIVTHSANVKKKKKIIQNCFNFIFPLFLGNVLLQNLDSFKVMFQLPQNFISQGQIVSQNVYILLSNFFIALTPCS